MQATATTTETTAPTLGYTPAEREALILEFYPMVRRVAYRMARRFPRCVDADDLVHIGMIGLIDAVDRYQDHRAGSFAAYARIRVQGAILDEMRKNDWVPRSVRDRAERIEGARKDLATTLGRAPSTAELAGHIGVNEDRLQELLRTADVRTLVSTEEGGEDEATVGETLAAEADPVAEAEREDIAQRVRSAVAEMPERDRVIIDLYYFRDLNFKEIGEILNVTESRVSQLHTRLRKQIREKLLGLEAEAV